MLYKSMNNLIETRKKIWNDRTFAEIWEFRGEHVLRHRMLNSYPWSYKMGKFTSNHCVYADPQHRGMTSEEITSFKLARSIR